MTCGNSKELSMKILVVDDHAMFADSIKLVLSTRHQITTVADGSTAITKVSADKPGMVLLDQHLPDIDGLTLLKVICALPEPPPVVLLSGSEDAALKDAARHGGAAGFLHKSLPADALIEAINKEEAGEMIWPPPAEDPDSHACSASSLVNPQRVNDRIVKELGITGRQIDVLKLLVEGMPNKSIANQLGIAESTVKTHVQSLFQVLKVTNRASCQNRARNLGLLD